jgi:peptide-methionine (S)-S-oxide reductase
MIKLLTVLALVAMLQAKAQSQTKKVETTNVQTATFGAGCFWCTEAVFLNVKGVTKVVSGYTGGKVKNPTYREICTGMTGHAEVTQITFDPAVVSFEELLEVFWNTHDPTTLNRQGADEGTQYRSAVFYADENQKALAEAYKKQLEASHVYKNPIVTEITTLTTFYPAEDYHQNYYELNPNQGYCQYVIRPKVDKFKKQFADKLKK